MECKIRYIGGILFFLVIPVLVIGFADGLPDANFSADVTRGETPLDIQFTDPTVISEGITNISWNWTFSDGNSSSEQNPYHSYASEGSFDVSLAVDTGNETGTVLKSSYISVSPDLESFEIFFSVDPQSGPAPLTVFFFDLSSGQIEWREWDFGDGSPISLEESPVHEYLLPGLYTVTLTVGNATDSLNLTITDQIIVESPIEPLPVASGTRTLLTPGTGSTDQRDPCIYGDLIAWSGYNGKSYDIFVYNLTNGIEIDITPDERCKTIPEIPYPGQYYPMISGKNLVWQDTRNGNSDIYLFNLSGQSEYLVTQNTTNSNQRFPALSKEWIAWSDDRNRETDTYDIYLFNISTREEYFISPDMLDVSLENPQINENYLVCDGLNLTTRTFDVYLYDIQTSIWILLTPSTTTSNEKNADIYGDIVTWDVLDELNQTKDIYIHYIQSNTTSILTGDTFESDQANPSIHGDMVVWEDNHINPDSYIYGIVASDLITGEILALTPNPETDQISPRIFNNRIIWQGLSDQWTWDIYLFTLGTEKPELEANFSANVSVGKCPLTVAFSDTSIGEPEFWHWDFGDGNSSDQQHPVRVYDTPGSYDVTLSTGNPYQRDRERKDAFVSVQAPPVCRFSVDPVSGIAPLTVQFSDESPGEPQSWHWDFGDGNTSDLENPVYLFSNPGSYTITLTVMNSYGNSTLSKNNMIMVANATELTMYFAIPGISIEQNGNNQVLILDGNVSPPYVVNSDEQELLVYPDNASGISKVKFQAGTGGFSVIGNTITGTLSSVFISSHNIEYYPAETDHGHIGIFNYSVSPNYYPAKGTLHSQIWEGVFPEDYKNFDKALDDYTPYGDIHDIAYSINLDSTGIDGGCTITAGVDSAWVRNFGEGDNGTVTLETTPPGAAVIIDSVYRGITPITVTGLDPGEHQVTYDLKGYDVEKSVFRIRDERDSIKILKISDDGGSAEVLNTSFLYHDPVQNLDYFHASSPEGMSRFAVSALGGPGNPFQLLYLTLSQIVRPKPTSSGGGGGGSGTSSGVAGAGSPITQIPTQSPSAALTPLPTFTQIGEGSENGATGSSSHREPADSGTDKEPGPTVTTPATAGEGGLSTAMFTEGTTAMALLKNLSVVGVVVIVTVVFYFRWKREDE